MWAMTGIPLSTRRRIVGAICLPPSTLTDCAPACARKHDNGDTFLFLLLETTHTDPHRPRSLPFRGLCHTRPTCHTSYTYRHSYQLLSKLSRGRCATIPPRQAPKA